MKKNLSNIVVFTDGASRGNPGSGGFAAIVVKHDDSRIRADRTQINADDWGIHVVELGGREEHTTNNRMELQAAISALSIIHNSGFIIRVYTDSAYLLNGITRWVHGWQKNGWKTKAKQDVENRDLWEKLVDISRNKDIQWKQIAGHVGVGGNHRCDEIATAFADGKTPHLYAGALPNYSIQNVLDISEDAEARVAKRETRTRQNAKAYSYVSMVDDKIETHKTWAECEARVKGKRRARYKKVFSGSEEKDIMNEWSKK